MEKNGNLPGGFDDVFYLFDIYALPCGVVGVVDVDEIVFSLRNRNFGVFIRHIVHGEELVAVELVVVLAF